MIRPLAVMLASGALLTAAPASAPSCAPRQAWFGVEAPDLHNGQVLASAPATSAVQVSRVTVDLAAAPLPPAPGFYEVLALVGVSAGSVNPDATLLPAMPADSAFGPVALRSTGSAVGGNTNLSDGVVAAVILKAGHGEGTARDVTLPVNITIPAGGALWVRLGEIGPPVDAEAQISLEVC